MSEPYHGAKFLRAPGHILPRQTRVALTPVRVGVSSADKHLTSPGAGTSMSGSVEKGSFEEPLTETVSVDKRSRRDAILGAASAAILTPWAAGAESFEAFYARKYGNGAGTSMDESGSKESIGVGVREDFDFEELEEGIFGTPVYLVLRFREATAQQERLVRSGKYKDLQRSNVRLAVRILLGNYGIQDSLKKAAKLAPKDKREAALAKGREAIETLKTLDEYFDPIQTSLKLADLDNEKQEFVAKAFATTRKYTDDFLKFLPADTVSEARAYVEKENNMNKAELEESGQQLLNPDPGK